MQRLCAALIVNYCSLCLAQSPALYFSHAAQSKSADGSLIITASSPRPMEQAASVLRREFGWTVDYEDPQYGNDRIRSGQDSRLQLVGGKFKVRIVPPANGSPDAEQHTLQQFVNAFNAQKQDKFKILRTSDQRFDIVPDVPGEQPVLDTPVAIDSRNKTIGETIDWILARVSEARGVQVVRVGIIDNGLENTRITLTHKTAVPARQLLNEALGHLSYQRFWILTYEPNDQSFYIGIQPTVKTVHAADGKTFVMPVVNLHSR